MGCQHTSQYSVLMRVVCQGVPDPSAAGVSSHSSAASPAASAGAASPSASAGASATSPSAAASPVKKRQKVSL